MMSSLPSYHIACDLGAESGRVMLGTFEGQRERVAHFARRISELSKTPTEVVITLINVNENGEVADALVPNADWQAFRDAGEVPFARGLAGRPGMQDVVDMMDPEAGAKLRSIAGVAVIVMDHGAVEIFEYEP